MTKNAVSCTPQIKVFVGYTEMMMGSLLKTCTLKPVIVWKKSLLCKLMAKIHKNFLFAVENGVVETHPQFGTLLIVTDLKFITKVWTGNIVCKI